MRAVVVVVALTLCGAVQAKDALPVPEHHIAGRALLQLRPSSTALDARLKAIGDRHRVDLTLVRGVVNNWLLVEVRLRGGPRPTEHKTASLVAELGSDRDVIHAETERWARAFFTPNDPFVPQMWPLTQTNLFAAWDDERGAAAQRIGVVDSGLVRGHEDVGAKAIAGFDFISDFNNSNFAADGNGRDSDFADPGDACPASGTASSYHGTHVAGTLVAAANNSVGSVGVNHNARLAVARALGRCGGSIVDIMEGAVWLSGGHIDGVADIGADRVSVVNLSLGASGPCGNFEQQSINTINGLGTVFVAAVGNDGGNINSPGNCQNVISVGAVDRNGAKTSYTSSGTGFGGSVTIFAPGGLITPVAENGVLSTLGPANNNYGFFQGTSMAAPHVAGIISLLQAKDPTLDRARIISTLTSTGTACPTCGGKVIVNASAALAVLTRGGPVTEDAFEENDAVTTAKRVTCGSSISGFAAARDQDWFFVDVAPGPLTVTMSGGAADLDLYLLRGVDFLVRSQGATSAESVAFTATTTERLNILIDPFADATTANSGAWALNIACTPGTIGEGEGEGEPGEGEGEGEPGEGEGEGEPGEGEGEGEGEPGEGEGEGEPGEGEGEGEPGEGEGEPGEGEGEGEPGEGEGEGEGEDLVLPTADATCAHTSSSTSLLGALMLVLLRPRRRR